MTDKVHGFVAGASQALTGGLDFFTVYTTQDITPTGVMNYTPGTLSTNYVDTVNLDDAQTSSQWHLDKLVETISGRGQPVFMTAVTQLDTVPAGIADFAPAAGPVYTLQFAIEHNFAWDVFPSTIATLPESLNGIGHFINIGASGAATNTITVVKNASYSNDFNVNIQGNFS